MFSLSIISGLILTIEYAIASFSITSLKFSLLLGVIFFESIRCLFLYPFGNITAEAVTGPAKEPLPASSTPAS